jgi:hypothetical protein
MTTFIFTFIFLLVLTYLFACHYFRFRRIQYILRKYNNVQLDYRTAQDISLVNGLYEIPYMMGLSTSFALFKTYGIPTISRLLVQTNQLAQLDIAGRRAEDTGVLLGECLLFDLDSDRARMGLARINYIHSLYRKSISNDDMLYTLSLFILEPIRWTKKYDWRSFTFIEEEARFLLWKEVGERMGIENIPSTCKEIQEWSIEYEIKYMIYSKDNQICGEATLTLMLSLYPNWMRSFIRKALISLIDERLRLAMGFEEAPLWMKRLTITIFKIRAFLLRHCTLPRIFPDDKGQGPTSCIMNKDGRYQRTGYLFEPWYVKETWFNKLWPFSKKRPGPKYKSHGFKTEELGPEQFAGKGVEAMKIDVEKMKERAISSDES